MQSPASSCNMKTQPALAGCVFWSPMQGHFQGIPVNLSGWGIIKRKNLADG